MSKEDDHSLAPTIHLLRGQRVILDSDLARLYGVHTGRLNQQVRRNHHRFPPDFIFQLTREETLEVNLLQIATGSQKHRDPRKAPLAFTEHGAIMAATILNSPKAVEMSVFVAWPPEAHKPRAKVASAS